MTQLLALLSDRYGRDKSSKVSGSVLERVISRIRERSGGSGGIKGLARTLSVMDNNGDKQLSKEELKYGLANYGIELNLRELDDIFSVFDRDHNGVVSLDELLVAIKGDMNPRRKALVERAFRSLDKDGSGTITIDEMLSVYDASQHPEVIAGKKSKNEVIREFMRQWDGGDMDGVVTYQEFEDYYKGISASIDGDDYFELMIRNAWRMAGGKGMAANTANKRLLVTNKDGSQQVVTVENELGVRPGDMEGYRRRLAQQGVEGELGMYGGVDTTERATKVRYRSLRRYVYCSCRPGRVLSAAAMMILFKGMGLQGLQQGLPFRKKCLVLQDPRVPAPSILYEGYSTLPQCLLSSWR